MWGYLLTVGWRKYNVTNWRLAKSVEAIFIKSVSVYRVGHDKVARLPFCTYYFLYLRYATYPGYFFVAHSVYFGGKLWCIDIQRSDNTIHEGSERCRVVALPILLGAGWRCVVNARPRPLYETRYPLYKRLIGPQGRSVRVLNISPPPGFDPRTS